MTPPSATDGPPPAVVYSQFSAGAGADVLGSAVDEVGAAGVPKVQSASSVNVPVSLSVPVTVNRTSVGSSPSNICPIAADAAAGSEVRSAAACTSRRVSASANCVAADSVGVGPLPQATAPAISAVTETTASRTRMPRQ